MCPQGRSRQDSGEAGLARENRTHDVAADKALRRLTGNYSWKGLHTCPK